MTYVLDTGPLILMFRHYYPDRFPSLWQRFESMRNANQIVSVREVARELEGLEDRAATWVKSNRGFFETPTVDELEFVTQIFNVPHFQSLVREQERLQGKPSADPFVIAKATCVNEGCVITAEGFKLNAAKIPNVCGHFDIECLSLEEFMEKENWTF